MEIWLRILLIMLSINIVCSDINEGPENVPVFPLVQSGRVLRGMCVLLSSPFFIILTETIRWGGVYPYLAVKLVHFRGAGKSDPSWKRS